MKEDTVPTCQSEDQGGYPACDLPATFQTREMPRSYFCSKHRERFYRIEDTERVAPTDALVSALEARVALESAKLYGIALEHFDAQTIYRKRLEDALGMQKTNWWKPVIDRTLEELEKLRDENARLTAADRNVKEMTNLTPDEKATLRAAAEAATPGPWAYATGCGAQVIAGVVAKDEPGHVACAKGGWFLFELDSSNYSGHIQFDEDELTEEDACEERAFADSKYIALANPSTVLALLDENARLTEEVKKLKGT